MHARLRILLVALVCLSVVSIAQAGPPAVVIDINGSIGPASADHVRDGFRRATEIDAPFVVLRLDTPGGLDAAMRDIVKEILGSRVPVVGYVAPSGARAASAGTYILQACHVAAMAPATTLGSATPVQIGGLPALPDDREDAPDEQPKDLTDGDDSAPGGTAGDDADTPRRGTAMQRKIINDAASYLRGLAQLRGRNADWAEEAVRSAANLAAAEALASDVIDVVARDLPDLMAQLDGRRVDVSGSEIAFATADIVTEVLEPDWRTQLLGIITDPNVAYILLLIGIYGLIYELANPGALLPGVAGAIALVLALYAFQALPVSFAGLALLLLGLGFMVLEAFVPSFGALGIGGAIAFAVGSVMLYRDDAGQIGVAIPVIATFLVLSLALFVGVIGYAVKTRNRPVVSGAEELIGTVGEALEDFDGTGRIRVHSESWQAHCDAPVRRGQRVRVLGLDGLILKIEEVNDD